MFGSVLLPALDLSGTLGVSGSNFFFFFGFAGSRVCGSRFMLLFCTVLWSDIMHAFYRLSFIIIIIATIATHHHHHSSSFLHHHHHLSYHHIRVSLPRGGTEAGACLGICSYISHPQCQCKISPFMPFLLFSPSLLSPRRPLVLPISP